MHSYLNRAVNLLKFSDNISKFGDEFKCVNCRKNKYYKDRNCSGTDEPFIKDYECSSVKFTAMGTSSINYCPIIDTLDDDVLTLVDLYVLFKCGFLYGAGGVGDQPYWYINSMLNLKSADNEVQMYEIKRSGG